MRKVKKILQNKYLIAGMFFLVWMACFDPKDWSSLSVKKEKLKNLQKSEAELSQKIAETNKELSLLKSSASTIELYAREKYMMKKDNEEVFIVKTP